ncbi:lytic murein transglycosylase B [Ideonella dechloratans]|uniref:Lytic murein transglycosylase B n=1 Tax=Ideonella dechloratans TaxID=36863 RepID=A0A643FCC0_IDEDE|nr:lytic murein transglycosylase B [Ideonella dechloratans]KAB0582047.1 lytic murein transglycosylase B [Ideonella dechloratans]UFU08939.1 lytic murein transglycosylase B [Ideonella dechloratans]
MTLSLPVPLRRACRVLPLLALAGLASTALAAAPSAKRAPVKAAAVISDDSPDVVIYGQREDVVQFGRTLAAANQLDPEWVVAQLAQARFQPRVTQLVMPPPVGTAKNWAAYRARFVEPQRIGAGLRWWQDNAQALSRAEARYGVPPEIVAAIVGVETFYGRLTGSFKVIDALATLSFDFPSGRSDRSAFYRDELGAFLRWCAAEKRDPQSVLGSFAGAIGLPQFMPSSILKYAVDFDGDGRIDLNTHGDDVVGSVAHYLAEFGWQRGLVPTVAVTPPADVREKALMLVNDITPSLSASQMRERGAVLDAEATDALGPLALVELQNGGNAPSYVAGTRNFYVLTRYNWSAYYAMAVVDLARALRSGRTDSTATPAAPAAPAASAAP